MPGRKALVIQAIWWQCWRHLCLSPVLLIGLICAHPYLCYVLL